jgi:uncharacterized membrane protein (DUF485 family)
MEGPDRDWDAVEQSPEFAELTRRRRRIAVVGMSVFGVWFGGFLVLTAWARDFMAESIYRGFTVAYALALSLIVMTWLIAFFYIRAARTQLDPLAGEISSGDAP